MSTTTRRVRGRSDLVTDGVRVQVESKFLPLHSRPERNMYQFVYRVTIMNERRRPIQLLNRCWTITDALGRIVETMNEIRSPMQVFSRHWSLTDALGYADERQGAHPIADTPLISPERPYAYDRFCVLNTAFGSMSGHYEMMNMKGERFQVQVGTFNLLTPEAIH